MDYGLYVCVWIISVWVVLTSITSVHIGDQGWAERVEVGNHLGVLPHLMQLGNS